MKKIFIFLLVMFVLFLGITTVYAADDGTAEEKTCKITFNFVEQDLDGNTVNSGNGFSSFTNEKISLDGTWQKFSKKMTHYPTFSRGGTLYEFVGWYEEDGTLIPETADSSKPHYYKAGDPTRIYTDLFTCKEDTPSEPT